MTLYSIHFTDATPTEENLSNGFNIPISNDISVAQIASEISQILEEFFPGVSISKEEILYAAYAAEPSWISLSEDEVWYANFEVSPCG